MQKAIALFLASMACATLHAQWTQRPSGTHQFLRDVYFPTPELGFAVGDSGVIVRTQDAGDTWSVVHGDGFFTFYSVHFPTPLIGYAAGGAQGTGVVLKTIDGGLTWASCFLGAWQNFGAVYFVDTLTGYVGSDQMVLRTTDGGGSWFPMVDVTGSAPFTSIQFHSPQLGYFIGGANVADQLWKTTDGGLSAQQITNGFQSIK